jgi:hypothetical protein
VNIYGGFLQLKGSNSAGRYSMRDTLHDMVTSAASTVEEYLDGLPEERRSVMAAMRKFIRKHLPKGYVEAVQYGMIGYGIPLSRYPDTYNGQPLGYLALAAQKNHYALYMMGPYGDPEASAELRDGFAEEGKKLDMGKSCLRFKAIDDLALDAVGKAIASTPPQRFIEIYEAARANTKSTTKSKKRA